MIAVERPEASDLVKAALGKRNGTTRLTEFEAAVWFHLDVPPALDPLPDKPDKAPDFEAYGDPVVKDALNALFGGHCAYCESRYDAVSPMDVEHYRPKAEVIEADGTRSKPAYYWLAMDWENLLPSCIGCNRARGQEQMLADGTIGQAVSGKGNLFPLRAGTARARAPKGEKDEEALLLDPCRNDPRPHLVFRSDGFVEPRRTRAEKKTPRGMSTIDVCGLDRAALVERRHSAVTFLLEAMDAILSVDYDCRRHPGDPHYEARRARKEADLEKVASRIEYRALTRELRSLFDRARARLNAYFEAEAAWLSVPSQESRTAFTAATREIARLYDKAGPHRPFVIALYGLADIPLDRVTQA